MENMQTKGLLGCIAGVAMFLYNSISEIIIVLVLLMIFDYITGVLYSLKINTFDKKTGAWGAVQKLMYSIIVSLGFLIDLTLINVLKTANIDINLKGSFGIVVVLYLIGNEGLSITKNLINLGLPVPPIIAKAFGIIQNAKELQKEGVSDNGT